MQTKKGLNGLCQGLYGLRHSLNGLLRLCHLRHLLIWRRWHPMSPCVRHSIALRVKFFIVFVLLIYFLSFNVWYVKASVKYEWATLIQLGEMSHKGHFNTKLLDNAGPGRRFAWHPDTDTEARQTGQNGTKTPIPR